MENLTQQYEFHFVSDHDQILLHEYIMHIEFPHKANNDAELHQKYYPINKSHLELLLDQYFLVESYPERERRVSEIWGTE